MKRSCSFRLGHLLACAGGLTSFWKAKPFPLFPVRLTRTCRLLSFLSNPLWSLCQAEDIRSLATVSTSLDSCFPWRPLFRRRFSVKFLTHIKPSREGRGVCVSSNQTTYRITDIEISIYAYKFASFKMCAARNTPSILLMGAL